MAKTPRKPVAGAARSVNDGYEDVSVEALQQHPRNPRKGSVAAISSSIDANGFYGAVVVQRGTNYILAGNHRFLAAKEAGWETVPVIWVEVDDEAATRILLADNRTADIAGYDDAALRDLLTEIAATGSMEGTGYLAEDLEEVLAASAKAAAEAVDELTDKPELEKQDNWNPQAVISYNLIFDNEEQKDHWFDFMKFLRAKLGEEGTNAERIDAFIAAAMGDIQGLQSILES